LGEKKGEKFYGVYVYDYTINVFCMIQTPSNSNLEINNQCSTLDIFPTILELANISKDNINLQGKSLLSLKENNNESRDVFVETGGLYGPWPSPEKHNVFCVKSNRKKLIFNETPQTWEFYDLKKDPNEQNNLYDTSLQDVKTLKKLLIKFLQENNVESVLVN
jgi:arylsulfatase A-like enzyme